MNIKSNKRFGGALVIVIIAILVIGLGVGAYFGHKYNTGKALQEKQTKLWNDASTFFNEKQPERAVLTLDDARSTFGEELEFYRKHAGDKDYLTKSEIDLLIVLICQSEIYDNLFRLESARNWLDKSKLEIAKLEDKETKEELNSYILRAEEADKLCEKYREYVKTEDLEDVKYQELVKDSLKIASDAIESEDSDYAIFEVRFLIACGKSFDEPILIEEAQNQLQDITKSIGENEKTKLLWGLLKN